MLLMDDCFGFIWDVVRVIFEFYNYIMMEIVIKRLIFVDSSIFIEIVDDDELVVIEIVFF